MKNVNWEKITIKELAAIIGKKLRENGVKSVLVGGACVAIYSNNEYLSYDLDFITYENMKKVEKILLELGFKMEGRHFEKENCPFFVEFVSPPIAVGEELVEDFNEIDSSLGKIVLLKPVDCIKDRLAAYYHWNDLQSLEQAVLVAKNQKINLEEIKEIAEWSKKEGFLLKFEKFKNRII
jgi:predicted nucleotidyltransferase